MTISYKNVGYKRTIATFHNQDNIKALEVLLFPLSFYKERQDDINDPFVPYTFEMYLNSTQCAPQLVEQTEEIVTAFINIINSLLQESTAKCIFVSVDDPLYSFYWSRVVEHLLLSACGTTLLNNEQTEALTTHWPNFLQRFNSKKMMMFVRDDYKIVYQGAWWDTTKQVKG